MTEHDYEHILHHLALATQVVLARQGELSDADVRIRHLLSITASETKRRLRELSVSRTPDGTATPHG